MDNFFRVCYSNSNFDKCNILSKNIHDKIGDNMDLVLNVVLLIVGFVLLIKGADFFVEGAAGIADKFHIPQMIIGLTIVAFGTSAPEAAVSISAGLKGTAGIAMGNVLGSNVLNILIILGLTACISTLRVKPSTIKFDMPFLVVVSATLVAMCVIQGEMNTISAIILTVLFVIFFAQMIRSTLKQRSENNEESSDKKRSILMLIVMTVGGMIAIIFGSDIAVDNAVEIAKVFGMSDALIGLTVIALGTSLPELITSITAARKGNADIAIGNVVGSNIFNILFVLGATSYIATIPVETNFIIDGIVGLIAAAFLYLFAAKNKKLGKGYGIPVVVAYVIYFIYLIALR